MPGLGRFFAVNVLADGPRQPDGVRTSRRVFRTIRMKWMRWSRGRAGNFVR
jgi:hypothetical protein